VLHALGERLTRIEATVTDRLDVEQLGRLEELIAELRVALADPPGTATLSRLVAQSHNALADRIAGFEQAVAGRNDTPVPAPSPPAEQSAESRSEPASFVALVPSPEGYGLAIMDGLLPDPGTTVRVGEADRIVVRVGPSPLPGDRRRCAFLEREGPPRPEPTAGE
jgi:hypothetical protein